MQDAEAALAAKEIEKVGKSGTAKSSCVISWVGFLVDCKLMFCHYGPLLFEQECHHLFVFNVMMISVPGGIKFKYGEFLILVRDREPPQYS